MALQTVIVAVLVAGCTAYAVWALMPAALRRRAATAMLRWPLPAAVTGPLRRAAQADGACGCSGCDAAAPRAAQPVRIHRRRPR